MPIRTILKFWWYGRKQTYSADGNRVIVGNFDADGLNVNNYWDDNRNDNIGVSSSRKSNLCHKTLL